MGRSSWIIWVGPKYSVLIKGRFDFKREKGHVTEAEGSRIRERRRYTPSSEDE